MRKFFSYIKYFFYLGYNWNVKIAMHILRQEVKGEKKYGIITTGADELRSLEKKGIEIDHSTIYMPVSYDVLEDVLAQLDITSYHHFLDIGCGKGRAMCVAACNGFTKLTGIDFSKDFCIAAEENLAIIKQRITGLQYKVINNDAFYFEIPADADCIFMFNPFDEIVMDAVAENILESFEIAPRKISLIYANPLHKEKLLDVGFKQIYHTQKMNYLEAVILELQ